ncbi:hypothetical protein L4C38_18195 [Vibrio kasasachensis]|uniref:hypothetical protein n=1 Tax=Vibrio kasasachensis TaxID=2910248 RepID=UPI003D0B5050
MQGKQTLAKRVLNWVTKNGKKTKAVYVLAGVSIGDFFVPALPTQTSVMLLAWYQPKKALIIALMFAFAAAAGASILVFISVLFESYIQSAIPAEESSHYQNWQKLTGYVNQYGLYALAAMSLLPTPPRTMVILSLLSGISAYLVVASVFLGKLLWFGGVVFIISRSPKWLVKLPWIGSKIAQSISHKQAQLQQTATGLNGDN